MSVGNDIQKKRSYVKFGRSMDMDPLLQPKCTHNFLRQGKLKKKKTLKKYLSKKASFQIGILNAKY